MKAFAGDHPAERLRQKRRRHRLYRLYGLYGSTARVLPKAAVDPYVFWRQSKGLTLEKKGTPIGAEFRRVPALKVENWLR